MAEVALKTRSVCSCFFVGYHNPDVHRALRETAEKYSALVCHPFARTVPARLPRELRDQVYDYLWDQTSRGRVEEWFSPSTDAEDDDGSLQNCVLTAPHFAHATFVGEDFASEAVTWFFSMLKKPEVDYRRAQTYIQMKNFGSVTIRPIDVIRHLAIWVECGMFGRPNYKDIPWENLRINLESLLGLPVRDNLVLEIRISENLQFTHELFRVLVTIRPVYHALVEKQVNIKVLGNNFIIARLADDPKVAAEQGRPRNDAEQLNCYFDGTPEEWFLKKEVDILAIEEARRRISCMKVSL